MDSAEARSLASLLGPDAWRLTPATFAHRISDGKWWVAPHLLYASAQIALALQRGNARIIVSMPPRHGKSTLISFYTPIWALDRWPDWPVILTSYGADLAMRWSRKVRDEIQDQNARGLMRVQIHEDASRVDRWETTQGGGLLAAGVDGPITGFGAKLLIIDDFLKSAKDAASKIIRDAQWEWFVATAMSRLEPQGNVIILATRWNLDDIIGRIKDSTETSIRQFPWTFINFPAIATKDDVLGRKPGDPLWPERYNTPALQEIENLVGPYFWQALYQQDPVPRSGGLVDMNKLRVVTAAEIPAAKQLYMVRAWDFAASAEKGDWMCGVKIGYHKVSNMYYVLDVIRVQPTPKQVENIIAATAKDDGPEVKVIMEQEPGSSGKILISSYQQTSLKGFASEGHRSTGEKFVRAQPAYAAIESDNTRMLQAPWNRAFKHELNLFPDAPNDDQVDAWSLGFAKINAKRYKGVTWGSRLTDPNAKATGTDDSWPISIDNTEHYVATKSRAQGSTRIGGSKIIMGVTFGRNKRGSSL